MGARLGRQQQGPPPGALGAISACAGCVPGGKTAVKGIAAVVILIAVALCVLVWFTGGGTIQIVNFVLALVIVFLGIGMAAAPIRCRPCVCS